MVKNIVFDMGNVLIDFNSDHILDQFTQKRQEKEMIRRELFAEKEWKLLDKGVITEQEALERVLGRVPSQNRPLLRRVMAHWHEHLPVRGEMYGLIKELKENGYRIYLLSNAGIRFHRYKDSIPALQLFDGILISADVLSLKPEPEIYQALFSAFSLSPEQCVFIDDLEENLEAGRKFGMAGCLFDGDMEKLRAQLKEKGVVFCTDPAEIKKQCAGAL